MIEVEVKIPIENIEKIKQKLLETGFIYQKTVVETDTYFTSDHYDMRKIRPGIHDQERNRD